jgi:hypothetical protein
MSDPADNDDPQTCGDRGSPGPAKPPLPRWAAVIFLAACLGIVPQIISLSSTLNEVQMANHWRTAWVGLDIAESVVFLLTAWFLFRGSRMVTVTASIAFAMLWMDAWFDVLTSTGVSEIATSRTLAVFIELPLGIFCLLVALRPLNVLHRPEWLSRATTHRRASTARRRGKR